jgi:hypothetical protein
MAKIVAMNELPQSTEALPSPRFPAHGCVVFERAGSCLYGDARGPFNLELVAQLQQLVPPLAAQMGAGPWQHLCRFHDSALTSPEALKDLGGMLIELARQGQAPARTAYVMGTAVEGAALMLPLFEQGFRRAGLVFRGFADEAEARDWLAL